jgi:hypothetical protein
MSWVVLTEAHLLKHISGDELTALRAAALAAGQADPVQPSIAEVTAEVLGRVAACRSNTLDADSTKIPDRLIGAACAKVVAVIIGRIPGYELDAKKVRALESADRLLRDVASCDFAIDDPATGDESAPSPAITARTKNFDRASQDGI